jgi:4-oxalocrotonate tautomerase
MPHVRIDLIEGKSPAYRQGIGEVVYEAMRATIDVPENDRFQVITEHRPEGFVFDRTYLGVQRSDDLVMIQVTLNEGRTLDKKKAFYKAVAEGLDARLGLRQEDVLIVLVEVKKENWSFGNGLATYAQ